MKWRQKLLRKFQWGRDFSARVLRLYRLDMEIWKKKRTRKLLKLGTVRIKRGEDVEFIKSYEHQTYELAVLITRYNELKFWFMKTKYPHTKPIK